MSNNLREIRACEVCDNEHLIPVLNLGLHPMCDDLVPIGSSRECREYPIEILFCEKCATAHQRFQVPKLELFPDQYHYRSRFTADVLRGMAELVESCCSQFDSLAGKLVVDIGCNDGSLLDFFSDKGAVTLGIEPTGASQDARGKGHLIYNSFLSEEIARSIVFEHGKPDFITFTNVFAHIEDLKGIFVSLKILMAPHTIIVIENHYLGAVLKGNQFDTFYHEHPRTYSLTSFEHVALALGVSLMKAEFPARYGGNIRVFLGNPRSEQHSDHSVNVDENRFVEKFTEMNKNIVQWRAKKKLVLDELTKEYGKLRAKAFPGRAAILIKLLNLDESTIFAVYEKPGSMKIGHYLPGTRIPIHSDKELFDSASQTEQILNLAWHIPKEIHGYLSENGYKGMVIDIIQQEDFSSV
jgi:hypothetical protein